MSIFSGLFRLITPVILCLFLGSCTQINSATSTYGGSIGKSSLTEKQRQAKILQARKRAALQRKKSREKFLKKRASTSKKKTSIFGSKKKTVAKKAKKRSVSKKKSARTAKKRAKKVVSRSIKGTKYAFVAGRSKGISKNRKPWRCVPARLKKVLAQVAKKYGRVVINSTHRSSRHNRLVGGKRRSYHLRCQAVDFRVKGRTRGLTRWLARHPYVGGFKRYRSGYYHIDTGPKRTW